MSRRQRRLLLIGLALGVLGLAAALALSALRETIVFFHSPTEIAEKNIQPGTRIRIGGLVKEGTIKRDGLEARFEVTDGGNSLPVVYRGVLPDLFREGQGVVAEGVLDGSGGFRADTVLAKHDENYMPREVVDALKEQGYWQHGVKQ
ncbi:MAG: cytochrome c maturation protein CcmE [Bradyrhizobiaceae bacterium]|nr:cytochrome c maturation protein CcmE [Bradyrhizobiaceae bacterium]